MILVVTEGAREEPELTKMLCDQGFYGGETRIVPYGTNIHFLISRLKEYGQINEGELDVSMILREVDRMINHGKSVDLLSQKYSDILLFFDLDPQDGGFSVEDVFCFVKSFSKDTTEGKLFINYPMFESLFSERQQVDVSELSRKGMFKQEAHKSKWWRKFSRSIRYGKSGKSCKDCLSEDDVRHLLDVHKKRFLTITGNDYLHSSMIDLFLKQKALMVDQKKLFCINTSILSVLDFSSC